MLAGPVDAPRVSLCLVEAVHRSFGELSRLYPVSDGETVLLLEAAEDPPSFKLGLDVGVGYAGRIAWLS